MKERDPASAVAKGLVGHEVSAVSSGLAQPEKRKAGTLRLGRPLNVSPPASAQEQRVVSIKDNVVHAALGHQMDPTKVENNLYQLRFELLAAWHFTTRADLKDITMVRVDQLPTTEQIEAAPFDGLHDVFIQGIGRRQKVVKIPGYVALQSIRYSEFEQERAERIKKWGPSKYLFLANNGSRLTAEKVAEVLGIEVSESTPRTSHIAQVERPTSDPVSDPRQRLNDLLQESTNALKALVNKAAPVRFYSAGRELPNRKTKQLRSAAKNHVGVQIKLSHAFNLLARMHGFTNWDHLAKHHDACAPSEFDEDAEGWVAEGRRAFHGAVLTDYGLSADAARTVLDLVRPTGGLWQGKRPAEDIDDEKRPAKGSYLSHAHVESSIKAYALRRHDDPDDFEREWGLRPI